MHPEPELCLHLVSAPFHSFTRISFRNSAAASERWGRRRSDGGYLHGVIRCLFSIIWRQVSEKGRRMTRAWTCFFPNYSQSSYAQLLQRWYIIQRLHSLAPSRAMGSIYECMRAAGKMKDEVKLSGVLPSVPPTLHCGGRRLWRPGCCRPRSCCGVGTTFESRATTEPCLLVKSSHNAPVSSKSNEPARRCKAPLPPLIRRKACGSQRLSARVVWRTRSGEGSSKEMRLMLDNPATSPGDFFSFFSCKYFWLQGMADLTIRLMIIICSQVLGILSHNGHRWEGTGANAI